VAIERGEWDQAEVLADQAHAALRRARREESYATPLVCSAQARTALHRGDLAAVRRHLASAQRLRPLLTYALPHFAIQARIELARVYIALADLPGAWTLVREIDDLFRRRPDMGSLADQAGKLRAQLSRENSANCPTASALTAAELRLLPMLCTHMSLPEIAGEMSLSRNTIKSQVNSIYRKLGVSSRSQAITRSRELGLLAG
jgi:LuxR family maltose regulon positive regulatory protein